MREVFQLYSPDKTLAVIEQAIEDRVQVPRMIVYDQLD